MERTEIHKQLQETFCDVFDDDEIELSDSTTAQDIDDWDSLMHITLIVSVEKAFGIKIAAAQVGKLKNVGEMLDLISEKLG